MRNTRFVLVAAPIAGAVVPGRRSGNRITQNSGIRPLHVCL